MGTESGIMEWALLLDGKGGARRLDERETAAWTPADGTLWVHLDYDTPGAEGWLETNSGIPAVYRMALTMDSPRPRAISVQDQLLVVLRGINKNEGEKPEDMVSLRMWLGAHRVVTLRHRRLLSVASVKADLEDGDGPRNAGDFLVRVVGRLLDRIGEAVSDLDDQVDDLEDRALDDATQELRHDVAGLRRAAIALRRYIAPQRDAVSHLVTERATWLADEHRAHLREAADRATRYVEDLDAARDRATVTQEQIVARMSDQMNRNMYLLSLVAAVFVPLGLLTGLLGINVGGIPGTESSWAFAVVTLLLVVLAVVLLRWFKRLRWL